MRLLADGIGKTPKYRCIEASVRELGLIEPLVIFPQPNSGGCFLLLDGHVRYRILKDAHVETAKCLIAFDDEGYTYNHKLNRLSVARWGRLARIVRIFRVLRGLRAAKVLTGLVLRHRAENSFLAASLMAILLIIFCSTAILHFETAPDSNIKTAEDAIWWSFATITTVGYGDRFPVTSEGRFVAALLMCAGVGLFSTFSGLLAAWFLAPEAKEDDSEIAALRREVAALRETIERKIVT